MNLHVNHDQSFARHLRLPWTRLGPIWEDLLRVRIRIIRWQSYRNMLSPLMSPRNIPVAMGTQCFHSLRKQALLFCTSHYFAERKMTIYQIF